MYASMDPDDQLVGKETPLDKLFYVQTDASVSDNPMDSNWGGVDYTQQVIESGKYEDNEVGINIP